MEINKKEIAVLIGFILLCNLAGIIGSVFTVSSIQEWYVLLEKPEPFTPPNWVFAPVWTTLYTLMGISLFLVWKKKACRCAYVVFGSQLVLNSVWSIAFFGLQSPLNGLFVIVPLWLLIAWSIKVFYDIDKRAGYLLIPYILWTSYAAFLNYMVYVLNA